MSGAPSTPKRSAPQPDCVGLVGLIELVQSVYSTPELEKAYMAVKAGDPGAPMLARTAIYGVLRAMCLEAGVKEAVDAFKSLDKAVRIAGDRTNQVLSAISDDNLAGFLVTGTLKTRYEKSITENRHRAGEYVAQKFFPDERSSCFVQASITAIHLARALVKKTLRPGSLFYTNSIVFPLILLQEHPEVSVYSYCGTEYDNLCGGWLPRHDDEQAHKHLRELFNREEQRHPLRDAFVTPMAVCSENGVLLFTRSELIEIVRILVQGARKLVIMTLASRLFDSREAADQSFHDNTLHALPNTSWHQLAAPQLVVAWDHVDVNDFKPIKGRLRKLSEHGFDVHWQDPDLKWHILPARAATAD